MALLLGTAGLTPTGCHRYATYPAIPTSEGIEEDPNTNGAAKCMSLAVGYVATRYSPGGYNFDAATAKEQGDLRVPFPIVVNAPRGMRRAFYQRVVADIGPQAMAMSPDSENSGVPVYHVLRVWLRQSRATVDVLRPMSEIAADSQGRPVYQTVTVRLEGGGLEPWRVVHARGFEPGIDPVPSPYYLPEVDRVNQFEWLQEQDKKAAEQPAPAEPAQSTAPEISPEETPVNPDQAEKPGS
ncbi:MAG: hypothetical protein WC718_18015 [Phycisphaerales bacterium]|jgi:hypothetical protein